MEWKEIKGASFMMGTNSEEGFLEDYEGPQVEVSVGDFYIADTTVTNKDFAIFVEETGYQTLAERQGWSFVFSLFVDAEKARRFVHPAGAPWWLKVPGASWKSPTGVDSDIKGLENHPVIHIALEDALAYCEWAGVELPTEAEWEYAARGGSVSEYPWGDELVDEDGYHANTWQGRFPIKNDALDGFVGTAPVYTYPENQYGLYQMIGNVWEWCCNPRYTLLSDFNTEKYHLDSSMTIQGEYAIRGGSFLCHSSHCNRYRVAARNGVDAYSTTSHLGFRCIKRVSKEE